MMCVFAWIYMGAESYKFCLSDGGFGLYLKEMSFKTSRLSSVSIDAMSYQKHRVFMNRDAWELVNK